MRSAFGIEHTVSKNKTLGDLPSQFLPGTAVRAYDNSQHHKREAASIATAGKVAGGIVGGLAGVKLAHGAFKKFPALAAERAVKVGGKTVHLTRDGQKATGRLVASSVIGGAVSNVGAHQAFQRVKRGKRYGYKA